MEAQADEVSIDPEPVTPDDRVRLGEIYLQTNNATHIQQFVLALVDAGFEATTTFSADGCYVQVFWRDRVAEE